MSVTSWNYLEDGTWGPRISADGTREYQIRIEVHTDGAMSGLEIVAFQDFPAITSQHPSDPFARCNKIGPPEQHDIKYWTVDYGYSTRSEQLAQGTPGGSGESNPQHDPDDPLSWAPKIKLSTKMFKKTIFIDLDGFLVRNAAGEVMEALTIEVPRLVIDVQRNIASFDYTLLNECVGGVNVGAMIGYEARRVKCELLEADETWEKNTFFWDVRAQFIVGNDDDILDEDEYPDGWWYEWRLNAGYSQLVGGVLTPIIETGGQRPSRPVPLDANGVRLAQGSTAFTFQGFRVLRDAPLNAIGLFD